MPRKLLQAVVITFALYLLMGMQSRGDSIPQSASKPSHQVMPPHHVTPLQFARIINLVKGSI
ncbi:hypothetical protein H6G89_06115 [Oscillatoria sp. FACHB-1407]|uniref:hypothetical protein n=1 Tax=Oscillatoria sp. FACHB-1407 TaxID=2692847 RepID=UPI0016865778|nr:hypothetical protein [Oscillatoria sp. FACHB-1407]MBD2460615.1 hypothetical protein [Oscillatoria sp. FACHB-1407]